MIKTSVNNFIKGMNKDVDKSVMSKDSYLNAENFRIVTSEGSSSGALENIKGNKWANENHLFEVGQFVCGSVRLRDYLIIFTTSNTGIPIHGSGRNMIYRAILDKETEEISSLTVLYDDNLNNSTGTLDFSTANIIKAVSKYETPNIQKVYWTDSYNNLRYADVAKNLTIDGEPYNYNNYMAPEMFEFLPLFTSSKPALDSIITGHLQSGMIQYAYQLYKINGASTAFSPVSDMIHIVSDNDFANNTLNYNGDAEETVTGKGCKISIDNQNIGYDRLRLVRIHYTTLNSIPVISVAAEIEISTAIGSVYISDVGESIATLTLDEFNILSTELFSCEDVTIKDNRLFAANINKDEFVVDNFDSRAVRFRNYTDATPTGGSDTVFSSGARHGSSGVTFDNYTHNSQILITIPNFSTYVSIPAGRTVSDVTAVSTTRTGLKAVDGEWHEADHTAHFYSSVGAATTFSVISYNSGTDELQFIAITSGTAYLNLALYDHMSTVGDGTITCDIFDIVYSYDYTVTGDPIVYTDAVVYNGSSLTTIETPVDPDDPDSWDDANWVDYTSNHDGINRFNDTDNDGDESYEFIYQSDGTTIGAEGPNVKIDFETETFLLENSNVYTTYYAGLETDGSYTNYASPWKSGELSWQRDEVYRLFVVWKDNRGRNSAPQWIIDLRMPSFHMDTIQDSESNDHYPYSLVSGTYDIYSCILRPRILFKEFPDNAVSCQIYRVKREKSDRSIVFQGLAVPTIADGTKYYPDTVDEVLLATDGIELIKVMSPEISISKNVSKQSNDYIEYVTNFSLIRDTNSTTGDVNRNTHKMITNQRVAYSSDTRSEVEDAFVIEPAPGEDTIDFVTIDGKTYCNYHPTSKTGDGGKGGTGMLISYANTSWSAEGVDYVLVNYRSKVFGSQYGGNTYEDRQLNISIPCSDIITAEDTWYSIKYGDTFITYFDVSTLLYDLTLSDLGTSQSEVCYVPLESSINCNLRHDKHSQHLTYSTVESALRQEYAGEHIFVDTGGPITLTYYQDTDLYLYNTVYSQQPSVQYAISEMLDISDETDFDCLVKASGVKYNGENSDSWTNFRTNEEIEVESNYGEIKAIENFNGKLLYWQRDGFGILAVNDRSLIQDNLSSQLQLGTGGVLDRYDYISTTIGIVDKRSLVLSDSSVYWFYDKDTSIYKFDSSLVNLTKSKGMWSWFRNNYDDSHTVHGIYDREYNEVIYTLYAGYTNIIEDNEYGALYNWYAANSSSNIAASGWHVPTFDEFSDLILYLDPLAELETFGSTRYFTSYTAGGKLKEIGFTYWNTPNTEATNEVGFNARGCGWRGYDTGIFYDLKEIVNYWCSDNVDGFSLAFILRDSAWAEVQSYDDSFYSPYRRYGDTVRLVKDSTVLSHGQTGTYIGNDGKVYPTICINDQEWLALDLIETKYRDGSSIPIVVDNTAWISLSTGAMCYYNNDEPSITYSTTVEPYTLAYNEQTEQFPSFYDFTPRLYLDNKDKYLSVKDNIGSFTVNYGALYNWYVTTNIVDIAASGWHIPITADWSILYLYLDPLDEGIGGGKLKEIGTSYWLSPNIGATNEVGFNARGAGVRLIHDGNGVYDALKDYTQYWVPEELIGGGVVVALSHIVPDMGLDHDYKPSGLSIRLVKDSTDLSHGETGIYTGNDGKLYPTICIGTQEWLACNLCETKYRDGTSISLVTDAANWAVLTTGAMCYYDNDINNAFTGTALSYSYLYTHNSSIEPRCEFYGDVFASTIKLLYNDDYLITKAFDNIFYNSNAFDEDTDVDQYNITFDRLRCYDDYQNTDWVDLTYPVNIMRRERGWTIAVPRNKVLTTHTSSPDIFDSSNLDSGATKTYQERIRDKYMVLDLSFDNSSGTRFVVPFMGLKYRLSYR